jgi:hypothetical protein
MTPRHLIHVSCRIDQGTMAWLVIITRSYRHHWQQHHAYFRQMAVQYNADF